MPDDFDPNGNFPHNLDTNWVTTRRGYCDRHQNHSEACDQDSNLLKYCRRGKNCRIIIGIKIVGWLAKNHNF